MRSLAHIVLITCCLMTVQFRTCPAQENRPLKCLGQVKIEKTTKNLGATAFRPELSIEQNNQILAAYRSQTTTLSAAVPWHLLANEKMDQRGLVNRPIRLEIQGHFYAGRVTAVMLDGSHKATVFAQLENPGNEFPDLLKEETGVLSIGE